MQDDLNRIQQQWDALFALCEDDQAFNARADDVSAWGVPEQLAHVGLSMNLIADAIDGMIANPEENAGLKPADIGRAVLQAGAIPRGAGQAPERIVPQSGPSQEEVRAMLNGAKERWEAYGEQSEELSAIPATFPHFALGNFTCAQWTRFVAIHNDHHLGIVRDILQANDVSVPFH